MIFTIKMHKRWFLQWKCIRNDFYYKNAWEMIFTIKCIRSDFYYKNALEMIFIIKMH